MAVSTMTRYSLASNNGPKNSISCKMIAYYNKVNLNATYNKILAKI